MTIFEKLEIVYKRKHLTFRQMLNAWIDDQEFCVWFTDRLSRAHTKFRFEFPKLTHTKKLSRPAYVIRYTEPRLSDAADPKGIYPVGFVNELLKCARRPALTIPGRGGLSHPERMVIPCKPIAHIGKLKTRAKSTIHEMWKQTALEAWNKLRAGEPVYISTHGLGIPWLHIRVETQPVHYQYKRFLS